MSEADCIFCKIVSGQIPAHKIYEDAEATAFLDIRPVNPGHLLVVPKNHVDEFQDMGGELYEHVMQVVHKLSRRIKTELNPARVGLMVWGFEVAHAHVHVVPLKQADDFGMRRPSSEPAAERELTDMATRLSS